MLIVVFLRASFSHHPRSEKKNGEKNEKKKMKKEGKTPSSRKKNKLEWEKRGTEHVVVPKSLANITTTMMAEHSFYCVISYLFALRLCVCVFVCLFLLSFFIRFLRVVIARCRCCPLSLTRADDGPAARDARLSLFSAHVNL